jgi:hypothetical protein
MHYLQMFILVVYFPAKIFAYSWWCYQGIRNMQLTYTRPKLAAFLFGLLRLALGLTLILILLFLTAAIYDEKNPFNTGLLAYLLVNLPVHWLEWSVMDVIMNRKSRALKFFIPGSSSASRYWRLGGVGINVLLDIPLIFATNGLPVGNFYMC